MASNNRSLAPEAPSPLLQPKLGLPLSTLQIGAVQNQLGLLRPRLVSYFYLFISDAHALYLDGLNMFTHWLV